MTLTTTAAPPHATEDRQGARAPPAAEGQPTPPRAPRPPLRKLALAAFLALVIVAGGAAWLLRFPEEREPTLVLLGNVDVRQVNLAFKVAGRIDSLAVDEGDQVKPGQVVATLEEVYFLDDLRLAQARRDQAAANLLRLENGSRPEEISSARAQVAERRATLGRAQEEFQRTRRLIGSSAATREELDRVQAALEEARARLNASQESLRLAEIGPRQEDIDAARAQLRGEDAQLTEAKRRLEDSRLIAPGDGTILTRAREKGAIVQSGETVFTLTLRTPVWARAYVNEPDLGLVRPGTPAGVRTDSAPGKVYQGRVGFISPTAEFTPKTVETRELRTSLVYRLRIVIDDPDGGLRQGMPVTVTLPLPAPRPRSFRQRLRDALPWPGTRTGG